MYKSHRVDFDVFTDNKLHAAKPIPSFGIKLVFKASSGLPRLIIISVLGCFRELRSVLFTTKGISPWYTLPTSPSAQETVTFSPLGIFVVAFSAPTTAGIPAHG